MKDYKGNRPAVFVTNGASNHTAAERETFDYYATPPEAVEDLLKNETFNNNILEPCAGGGTFPEH